MRPVVFLAPAEEELGESARYYEARVPGLGLEFLKEVERATARIAENPESGRRLRGPTVAG